MRVGIAGLLALLTAASATALDFTPCTETGHEDFDCSTLRVPLDRAGTVSGTVGLAIERLRQDGPPRPVVVALAGGPGQSATAFAPTFARVFAGALDRYQLVVFDQRGTGHSGVLDCPALREHFTRDTIAACGTSLGPAGEFYTTADSVLDVDAVRAALDTDRLVVAGVSYGTHVTLEYARTFPERTAAIVLDSTVPPAGNSPFDEASLGTARRVIADLCSNEACVGITTDAVADTERLVRRLLGRPLAGKVIDEGGHPSRRKLDSAGLFNVLRAGDLLPAVQARYPGAVAAGRRSDAAPLLRLAAIAERAGVAVVHDVDPTTRVDSATLGIATACADIHFPWRQSDPSDVRYRAFVDLVRGKPPREFFPFDRHAALRIGWGPICVYWPTSWVSRASSASPLPDVPALVLGGTRDIRTPVENADQVGMLMPQTLRVVVPNRGHSVLTGPGCARSAVTSFLHQLAVGDPCAGLQPPFPIEPVPPRTLGRVRPLASLSGLPGRVVRAVEATLNDAITSADTLLGWIPSPVRVGGLRAGLLTANLNGRVLDTMLEGYTFVPGVSLSGNLEVTADEATASVHVRGRIAGDLVLTSGGSVTGTLGKRPIALSVQTRLPHAAARTAAEIRQLPPIP